MNSENQFKKNDNAVSNVLDFCRHNKSFWLMKLLVGDKVVVKWRDHTTEEYHPQSNLMEYFAERRRQYIKALKLAWGELAKGRIFKAVNHIYDCFVCPSETLLTTIPLFGACNGDGSGRKLHYIEAGKHVFFTDLTISRQPLREFSVYRENKKISHICLRTTDTMS